MVLRQTAASCRQFAHVNGTIIRQASAAKDEELGKYPRPGGAQEERVTRPSLNCRELQSSQHFVTEELD